MAKSIGIRETVTSSIEEYEISEKIQKFLFMIADNTLGGKNDRDLKNELIRKLFKEGFEIHDPTGTFKVGSKVIQQCLWRVMSKVKFLNVSMHGTQKDEDTERLVSEGVRTVTDRGGLSSCFRDKGGVFQNAFMFGDGFVGMGRGENDENPVSYRVFKNEDVYYDNNSMGIRGVRPANRMCAIAQFDKEEAYDLWPVLEEEQAHGRIPGTFLKEESKDSIQDKDVLEVCWGWNKSEKDYVIFGGTQCVSIDDFEGDEYPFIKNNKPFIPVFQFLCQPSAEGFHNYGIGDMVYDLAVITRKLMNMEVGHLEENVYPITLINAPQSKVDELVEKMAMANIARQNGGKPFVAMEYGTSGQTGTQAQSLLTQSLFNEWTVMWDKLYKEISRLGINLDDIERGSGITRGQVVAEEQASNAFVMQMMEYNATETQELLDCSIDAIKEFVSDRNKTPLNLTTRITMPDGSTQRLATELTMGMLSKELKSGNWFAKTDARTGAIPSDLLKMLNWEAQLAVTPPGTPQFNELYRQIAKSRGIDMELAQQSPAPVQTGAPKGGEAQPQPSETQRVTPAPTGTALTPV